MTINDISPEDCDFEAVFEESDNFAVDFAEVIERVPSNYGLITWNGTILTVS